MNESSQTSLEVARGYLNRGWSIIPIPHRSKDPGKRGWQNLRITTDDAPQYFNGKPINFGLLTGEPSNWLVDVDLDHEVAVQLAPDFLPPTESLFGRASRPRSHWLYRVTGPVDSKKISSKLHGMLVELRSTGLQTVIPPSIHVSGEPIRWEAEGAEPTLVDPQELLEAVMRLGAAVKQKLGDVAGSKPTRVKKSPKAPAPAKEALRCDNQDRPKDALERCLNAMLRIGIVDRNDGSSRLYTAACRAVEHDLGEADALACIRRYEQLKPFPRHWSDEEVLQRLRDAEAVCTRGAAFKAEHDEQGFIKLGTRDPETGRLVLSLRRTLPSAEAFVREHYDHPDRARLVDYAGTLWAWQSNRYVEQEDGAIRQRMHPWLHESMRYTFNRSTNEMELVNFEANPGSVNAVLETTKSLVHLPSSVAPPCWLNDAGDRPPAPEILVGKTKLLHLPSGRYLTPTPLLFTPSALDYDPQPNAPEPTAWFDFLHQLFEDDTEAWDLVQQWFGYMLTADTAQQKALLLVGPRRSGKGTLGRVLKALIGAANVCGPTTSSLAGTFGLQPLLGKSLAIVSDARFSGDNITTVVERLLCITGEDSITIDRKHIGSVTVKLPTRFVFLTNELPRFNDSSAALAGRFLILQLKHSFYGKEDKSLTDKLLNELPGILNWAMTGWRNLRAKGRFVQPASSGGLMHDLEDLVSPVGAFVRDRCVLHPGCRATIDSLYRAWTSWCLANGRNAVGTKQSFGKDLQAAIPGVVRRRDTAQQGFYDGVGVLGGEL
jgi:putative DNA primase/helicase